LEAELLTARVDQVVGKVRLTVGRGGNVLTGVAKPSLEESEDKSTASDWVMMFGFVGAAAFFGVPVRDDVPGRIANGISGERCCNSD